MGEKQIRIRQSPLHPPDCATTISRLITNGMNGRQIISVIAVLISIHTQGFIWSAALRQCRVDL